MKRQETNKPTPEQDRRFFLICMNMRLQGVNPGWFYIWRSAFERAEKKDDWLDRIECAFPYQSHFNDPLGEECSRRELAERRAGFERGKCWWDNVETHLS